MEYLKFECTIRLTLSVNLDGQFEDGIIRSRSRPLPSEKIGEGAVCREGGDCSQASLRQIIHF